MTAHNTTAAELEKLLAEVTPDWRCAGKHMAIISDGNTGWDKPSDIDAYGGHLVCESVNHPAIKSLIIAAPILARKVIAAEKLVEAATRLDDEYCGQIYGPALCSIESLRAAIAEYESAQ